MLIRRVVFTCAVVFLAGCSSSSDPSGPSATPAAIITITSSGGVSPKSVTVPRGSQVQFVNSDRVPHDVSSNPHPDHTDCPEINSVGFLGTNQSRQTGNLNTARTCGFHDHDAPANTALQGSIIIQ